MVLESLIIPIVVAVLGGLAYSILGAYEATRSRGEEINGRKFWMSIPKAIIGAVIALGIAAAAGEVIVVNDALTFFSVFMIGIGSVPVLNKVGSLAKYFGNKDAETVVA